MGTEPGVGVKTKAWETGGKLPGLDLDEEEEETAKDGTEVLSEGHSKNNGLFIDV